MISLQVKQRNAKDIQDAILKGMTIVHINTEIRVAFRDALRKSLENESNEVAPYKFSAGALSAVEKLVEEKLKIFNFL